MLYLADPAKFHNFLRLHHEFVGRLHRMARLSPRNGDQVEGNRDHSMSPGCDNDLPGGLQELQLTSQHWNRLLGGGVKRQILAILVIVMSDKMIRPVILTS